MTPSTIEQDGAGEQRELLLAVYDALFLPMAKESPGADEAARHYLRFKRFIEAEAYLDAAMMLVPEGWAMRYAHCPRAHFKHRWAMHPPGKGVPAVNDDMAVQALGHTPALALLSAILRAGEGG